LPRRNPGRARHGNRPRLTSARSQRAFLARDRVSTTRSIKRELAAASNCSGVMRARTGAPPDGPPHQHARRQLESPANGTRGHFLGELA
jgi:hypothetical protein